MRGNKREQTWMRLALSAAVLGTALLASCSSDDENGAGGTGPTPAGGTEEGHKYFNANVYPQLEAACAKCHASGDRGAPIFLGASADASYTAIAGTDGYIAHPSQSPLIQKGLHSGPALSESQNEVTAKWLEMEATARGLQPNKRPPNLRAAFQAFGDCMDYNKWVSLGLNRIPEVACEGNRGQCKSCHLSGQASTWLDYDPADPNGSSVLTFNRMRKFPYVQRLVVGRVNASGAFDGLEASRRLAQKGREESQELANNHPRYSLPSAQPIGNGKTADLVRNLDDFVNETIDRMNAQDCANVSYGDAGPDARQ